MIGVIFAFHLLLELPGHPPIEHMEKMNSAAECAAAVAAILGKPSEKVLEEGGVLRASCIVIVPPKSGA